MSLQDALAKIRPHTASSLAHQKAPASLLVALESALKEQGAEANATAYFAILLTTLETSKSNPTFGEGDVLPAVLYLLALVGPYVPGPVIRSNISTVMDLIMPMLPSLLPHAPPLRSMLSFLSAFIRALDNSQLDVSNVRRAFNFALELTIDPRPKVRKRAADLVREVLEHPHPPLLRHPYTGRVGEWVTFSLNAVSTGAAVFGKQTKKAEGSDTADAGIHVLSMVKPIIVLLPESCLPSITASLLSLPRLGNPYLSQSSYNILASIVSNNSSESPDTSTLISALLSSPPLKADVAQAPAWLVLLKAAFSAMPIQGSLALDHVFKVIFAYLESNDNATRTSAADALIMLLSKSVDNAMVQATVEEIGEKKTKTTLGKVIAHVRSSLDALSHARAMPQILLVIASLIKALRHRPPTSSSNLSPTGAEHLVPDLIQRAGALRIKKSFDHKEAADEVLKAAMEVLGADVILRLIPLGLLPEERSVGSEPHAYILPLLAIPNPAPLSHFVEYFVPLSERMFDLHQQAESESRANEAKMWDVLICQVWAGLVGYCYTTRDLPESFNPVFAQLLSQILYNQPQLRPPVLKALKITVESNLEETPDIVTFGDAQRNIAHLRTQAESWFAVLFNVFGSVGQEGKSLVGDVISAWVRIAEDKEIITMYKKVISVFKQNISKPKPSRKGHDAPNLALMAQDLLVLLLPKLPQTQCQEVWDVCVSSSVISNSDGGVQKRGYRVLSKLAQAEKLATALNPEDVLTQLTASAETVAAPAKRDRITLFALLMNALPSTSLHVIPHLIPEAVLSTKEPAERTRLAAFDLVVAMGHKMKQGGVVKRSRLDGMDEDSGAEVQASIEEYITMVAAGLAGATPHMISATVTAISRLVFEFKDVISANMLEEIFSTILVFITSANREIVKSALGFIKLSIHTLPVELIRPHLKDLVPALLNWSGDHKNHFKVKVRHIFERMIRRFGWEAVYGCVGDAPEDKERGKVLMNIKKRKERAKRKKIRAAEEGQEDDDDEAPVVRTGDAFEDVLYGSESDIDDSDLDEQHPVSKNTSKRQDKGVRIRLDHDDPMDLLHGAADGLTAGSKGRRRKPGQDASRFKEDAETGRMIIDDEKEVEEIEEEEISGTAYKDTITSVDGFTRGPSGRIKFNKNTKKRRANEREDDGDVDMADAVAPQVKPNKKRKKELALGHEFKAKKAGGDVKKGGMEPYAYLPLSKASSKKGSKTAQVHLIGRR